MAGRSALSATRRDGKSGAMRVTLSLRGDYAVRAMLALAQHELEHADAPEPLSARAIAERMRIPQRFVAHVLSDLVRAELVIGSTGRRGGYRLTRPAESIDLLRVVDAAERDGDPPRCVLRGIPCDPQGRCAAHDAFSAATNAVRVELSRTTLAGLVDHSPSA